MIKIELGALIIAMCIVGYALYSYLDKRLRKVERTLYGDEHEESSPETSPESSQADNEPDPQEVPYEGVEETYEEQ